MKGNEKILEVDMTNKENTQPLGLAIHEVWENKTKQVFRGLGQKQYP